MAENKKPLYQPWNEDSFQSDLKVRGMTALQRWMYRTLLQAAFFHDTRPYLPNDDNDLWILSGCESLKQWQENRESVLVKFRPCEGNESLLENKRLTMDWNTLQCIREEMAEKGQRRAAGAVRAPDGTFKPGKPVLLTPAKSSVQPADAGTTASGTPASEVKVSEDKISEGKECNTTGRPVGVGSQGQHLGSWKNIALRHKRLFGSQASITQKDKYADACLTYGEDVVLACFDDWAPNNVGWMQEKGFKQPLAVFFKALPDMAEVQKEITEEEHKEEAAQVAEENTRQQNAVATETLVRQQMTEHAKFMEFRAPRPNEVDPSDYIKD